MSVSPKHITLSLFTISISVTHLDIYQQPQSLARPLVKGTQWKSNIAPSSLEFPAKILIKYARFSS